MASRRLPVGIQDFMGLRKDGFVYVDKTEYIWKLISGSKSYFLSRPRRFGKSLFISTLENYFSGEKELFHGLYIEEKENAKGDEAWVKYPVITFSLSGGAYESLSGLADILNVTLEDAIDSYQLENSSVKGDTLPAKFRSVIKLLYEKTGNKVVVLVDEYDKPLLSTMISNPEQERKNREIYKGFFSVLKDMDKYLKFVFFTGVTKFTKVSIFSDLNQLRDISLDRRYSGICGITEDELEDYFEPEIEELAAKQKKSHDECLSELAKMYDGYHFSADGVGVYNPFSLLNALDEKRLRSYWFETGTPDILIKKLNASQLPLFRLADGVTADESTLADYSVDDPDPIPLFYQSGYLTISGYDPEFRLYELSLPNDEVKYGFLNSLVPSVFGQAGKESSYSLRNMLMDLRAGKPDSFLSRLTSLFSSISYPEGKVPHYEGEWSRQIYLILSLMGAYTQCEVHMATGHADCVVKTADYIYVFEFKLDAPVEDAMAQIDDRGYAIPYEADERKIFKIGVVFSTEKRSVAEWKIE